MEVKENETMSKMSYKCIGCDYTYGALDMDRIFDIATSKMKCYRCQQEVIIEESILPTQQTRSSLARFNDQMMRIFILLERLEGIRLAHHLLEPPIGPIASNLSKVENEKNVEMNERAFNGSASITHSAMQQGNITIHMEGENTSSKIEAKEVVPWLHSGMQPSLTFLTEVGNSRENVNDSMDCSARKEDVDSSSESPAVTDIEDLLMSEFKEDISSRSVVEMKKETIDCDLISEGSASENGDTIYVEGRRYHIDELTPELVLQMTAAEKEAYDISSRSVVEMKKETIDCDLISEGSASENGDTIYVEGRRYHIDELTPELVLQMTAAEKEAYVRITQENFDC
uniref:Transcription factor TFIIE alpha subunit C-terminal domain-containing protein n=1 Tax=Ascaris lumbricoides TaxID=6252 RepID=A0A9J2Q8K7_ASCLU